MKRIFAFFLTAMLLIGMIPAASVHVHAEEAEETTVATEETAEATEEAIVATEETAEVTEETIVATEEAAEATEETAEVTEETAEATEKVVEVTTVEPAKTAVEAAAVGGTTGNLSWTLTGGVLTISGNGPIPDYGYGYAPWYTSVDLITKVVIEEGITEIGERVFYGFRNLQSISLPQSMTEIQYNAFDLCNSLTDVYVADIVSWLRMDCEEESPLQANNKLKNLYIQDKLAVDVVIPEGITEIPERAFAYCGSLKSVVIPEGVVEIDDDAFYNCANLESISLPKTLKEIGKDAFLGCASIINLYLADITAWLRISFENSWANPLVYSSANNKYVSLYLEGVPVTDLVIPEGITTIPAYAFDSCGSLESVTIPEGVASIGDEAFDRCANLESISLPKSLKTIGGYAFFRCKKLTDIYLADLTAYLKIEFENDDSHPTYYGGDYGGEKWLYLNGKLITDLVIPSDIKEIPDYAFYNCGKLERVTFHSSVTTIGSHVFSNCKGLKSLKLPDGLTTIGKYAFCNCSNLEEIYLPDSITTIDDYAFESCEKVKELKIPKGLKKINPRVFAHWNALTEVEIPEGVTTIGEAAFWNCFNLQSIKIADTVTTISNKSFAYCYNLQYVELPASVTRIGQCAFGNERADGMWHVFYGGTDAQWNAIRIGSENEQLTNAFRHNQANASGVKKIPLANDYRGDCYKCNICNKYSLESTKPYPVYITLSRNSQTGKPVLSWSSYSGVTKYEIQRATSKSGKYSRLAYATTTSYEDTSASPGKTYYYKVRAITFDGKTGNYGDVKSISCKLATPVVKTSVSSSTGKVKVSWGKVSGAKNYDVYRVSSSGKSTKLTTTTKTYYTDSSAGVGTTYHYKVKAVASSSSYNSSYSALVDGKRICAQADLSVKVASSGKPSLSWDKVSGAKSYTILRAESQNGAYTQIAVVTATSYTDKSAEFDKDYWYQVDVVGSKAGTDNATDAAVKIHTTCAKPSVSIKLSSKKPKVSWKPVEGATKYYVYRATSKSGKYTKVATVTGTSYTDKKAKKGKTYYYKVKAIAANSKANSTYSSIKSIKSK